MVREKPARSCRLKTASLQPRSHPPAIGVPVTRTWTFYAATATTGPSKFRCSATSRRIETALDDQIRHGLLAELAELDRRYRLVKQARRPGRRRNVVLKTHGYREFVRVAASTGKAIAKLDGAGLAAAARAEALSHIRMYSDGSGRGSASSACRGVDHRSAAETMVSRLQ